MQKKTISPLIVLALQTGKVCNNHFLSEKESRLSRLKRKRNKYKD